MVRSVAPWGPSSNGEHAPCEQVAQNRPLTKSWCRVCACRGFAATSKAASTMQWCRSWSKARLSQRKPADLRLMRVLRCAALKLNAPMRSPR
eukprot:9267466-Alexandrium_andersonii.AAC.1